MAELDSVLGLLCDIQSNDSAVIKTAELSIHEASRTNVDQLVPILVEIGTSDGFDPSARQAALLVLKPIILQRWSIGFEQFEDPAISQVVKQQVRGHLLHFISTTRNTKLENATALLLSKIASVDFPDEWPDLLDQLYSIIRNSKERNSMNNALIVLRDVITDALSEVEFYKICPELLETLFVVFQPTETLVSESDEHWKSRYLAAQCFHGCLEFFLMAEKSSKALMTSFAGHIIEQWMISMPNLIHCATQCQHPSNVTFDCIIECLSCTQDLMQFPDLVQRYIPAFLEQVWTNIKARSLQYIEEFVLSSQGDIGTDTTVADVICCEFNFLWKCATFEDDLAVKTVRQDLMGATFVTDILQVGSQLGQLTDDVDWNDEVNDFVTEETDMSIKRRVRFDVTGLLCAMDWNPSLLDQAWQTYQPIFHDSSCSIKLCESALNIIGSILDQVSVTEQKISSSLLTGLPQLVSNLQTEASGEVQVRAHIVAGIFASTKLADRVPFSILEQFLVNTCNIGLSQNASNKPALQVGCLLAFKRYMSSKLDDSMSGLQNDLLNLTLTLSHLAQEDLLSVLVEMVAMAAELNYENAMKTHCRDVIGLLFSLAAKDAANIELAEETVSTYSTLISESVALDSYSELCDVSVQSFRGVLMNAFSEHNQIDEYSPELILCLQLMEHLLTDGVTPAPDPLADFIFDPVIQLILKSEDTEILQSATGVLTALVEHASAHLKEKLELVLQVISKLLDPRWSESAVIGGGTLISAVIRSYGMALGEYLPKLVGATVHRLEKAEYFLLVQNLVSVFCSLTLESAIGTINLLVELNGLETVLSKWLGIFESLSGYEVIQQNVEALQNIYNAADPRVSSIMVNGDQVAPEGVIITRSKRSQLVYEKVTVPIKIIKIMAKEISTTVNNNQVKGHPLHEGAEFNDSDDEGWEDLPEVLEDQHECDLGTHNLIIEWFRNISQANIGGFHEIYSRLNEEEQNIIRQAINI